MKTIRKELACWGKTGEAVIVEPDQGQRLLFWQQAQYVPCWMMTDDVWFTSEWFEVGSSEVRHCFEPIMDKECRYNSVDIMDSGPVSATIHWQYALCDNKYRIFRGNSRADEYYTVYSDGMAVRKLVGWPGNENSFGINPMFWEVGEFIILCGKGVAPSNHIEEQAFTLMNLDGDQVDIAWPLNLDHRFICEEYPQISDWSEYIGIIHFKSAPDVFLAFPNNKYLFPNGKCPGCGKGHPQFSVFHGYSTYSHWPANPNPVFQRLIAVNSEEEAKKRPSHTSLVSIGYDYAGRTPVRPSVWSYLTGTFSNEDKMKEHVRSWLYPAEIKTDHFYEGYYFTDRTYNIRLLENDCCQIEFIAEHPIVNPVIKFDKAEPIKEINVNGNKYQQGEYLTQVNNKGQRLLWFEDTFAGGTKVEINFRINT